MGWVASKIASVEAPAAWPTEQTSPEDVFLVWLVGLPPGADIADAARTEITRLDKAAPLGPGPQRLRALMVQLLAAA